MREYQTKSGLTQYMPSFGEIVDNDDGVTGWCLSCGETQDGVEPDARRYVCEGCGKPKVYGFSELVLMGLVDYSNE